MRQLSPALRLEIGLKNRIHLKTDSHCCVFWTLQWKRLVICVQYDRSPSGDMGKNQIPGTLTEKDLGEAPRVVWIGHWWCLLWLTSISLA